MDRWITVDRKPEVRMKYVERAPVAELSAVAEAEWLVEGVPGERMRILADARTDLIALDNRASQILFNGPMTRAEVTDLIAPRTIGLRLRPGVIAEVAPSLRLEQLRDTELVITNPCPGHSEEDGLHRFATHLLEAGRFRSHPVVDEILHQIASQPNGGTLAAAMKAAPASERTIQRLFKEYVGLTPQQTVGVIRQNNVGRALRSRIGGLAELAHDHGYSDQPHLTRDFTRRAGLPPGRYAREIQFDGIVQDHQPSP
jgi:AraC-like DNA-binding protein